jgi:hypothetical protein
LPRRTTISHAGPTSSRGADTVIASSLSNYTATLSIKGSNARTPALRSARSNRNRSREHSSC